MKKNLLILALLCAVAQGAWAQDYDVWDGTTTTQPSYSDHAIQINTAAEMAWLMNNYTAGSLYIPVSGELGHIWDNPRTMNISINADFDMTAANWARLIGYSENNTEHYGVDGGHCFYVTCNGNGHTIKIKIDNGTSSDNYQGLFYGIGENAKVKNLHVDCYIKVGNARKVGGICGENKGTIENCWVSGHVESSHYSAYDADLGGIAGLNESGGKIKYCCVTADIKNTGGNSGVGGIAGSNDGTIQHVTFYGTVSVNHAQDNKWVGDQDATLENNYDSFNQGEYDDASGKDLYRYAIKYPYAINITTVGPGTYRADIGSETNVPRCYPDGTVTLTNTSGRSLHSISIKDADGNDISHSGDMNTSLNFTMPHKDVNVTAVFSSNWPGCTTGTGESGDPYIINSASDWNEFAQSVYLGNTHSGKYVKLTNNISVTTMAGGYQSDESYTPFSGTFDGDGHTLTLNVSNQSRFAAPFKCVSGATIKNLHTAGTIDGTGNADGKLLAGIVGVSFGNNTITGCVSSVTLRTNYSNDAAMAGLVAGTKGGSLTINGCVFNGSLQGGATSGRCAGFSGYEYTATTTTIRNSLFAPTSITVPTNDGYTMTFTRDDNATIDKCYYTQTLGTEQGSLAIFTTYAPSNLGSLVQDYGMVKTYENGLLFDGKYYFATSTSTGTGTEGDPYIISNAGQWETFVYDVNTNGNNYNGKYILLAVDLNVMAMVGTSETNSFQGTFLGNNHTLTFTMGTSGSAFNEEYCAPFRYTKGATIKDLKTAGDIYTSNKFATGLIGHSYGMTTITNCHVSTNIYSSTVTGYDNHDGTHGAFVAHPDGSVEITGCSFNGRLLTNNGTHSCGGFVGWHNAKTITVANSLYAPNSSIPTGWSTITSGATFVRGNNENITNCYYTETLGDAQGTKAYTLATAPANLGSLVQDYGMLKAYQNGILFGDTYYAVLNLSGAGTEADPYIIGTADQWNDFANYVTNGYKFSGKFVKLTDDIEVSTMAGGSEDYSFQGTFDGDGHTLTVSYNTSAESTAPFRFARNAIINNLHVDGTIATSAKFAGGIVGRSSGTLNITNCRSSVAINSSVGGDGTHGGIVARIAGGGNTIIIDGCVFDGSFATTNGTINCGGFVGWPVTDRPVIKNSLMKPSSVAAGMLNNTFARWYYEPTITNCYFVTTANLPTNQGAQAVAYATAPANLGSLVPGYSMMTIYENGILYDGTYYMAPAISLADNADNSSTISSNNGKVFDVTLADRTLYKNGNWNTLCLPFDVTLAGSPLAGATARPLSAGSIDGSTLNLTFGVAVDELVAGTPYIIKWPAAVSFTCTATSGTGTGDGGYDKLVDGNTNTKWCQNNGPWTCEFNTSVPVGVTGYTLTTGGDTYTYQDRNPLKWTLEAKVTSSDEWTVIDIRDVTANSGDALPVTNTTESQVYAIASERWGTYQYFRFTVSQSGGSWMQLSELTLQQDSDIVNPVFNYVTIDETNRSYDNGASGDQQVRFLGMYNSTTFTASDQNSFLLIDGNNTVYYPEVDASIGAQRAYFKIGADDPAPASQLSVFNLIFSGESAGVISRIMEGYGDETGNWAFIASPVAGSIAPTTVNNLIGTQIQTEPVLYDFDLYRLNPTSEMWENYMNPTHHDGFQIVNGQGYLFATQEDKTLVFSGIFNTENEKIIENLPVGFNLVGNPFVVNAYVDKPYYILNNDGSAILTTTSEDAIAPCHGVIVELDGNESVTFSTTPFPQQSMGNNGNIQVTLAQTVATRGGAEAKTIDNAIVTFNEGMELGKFHFGTQDANVYIPQDGKDYAVAYSSGVGEVPVNFKANRNGEYSLTINPEGVEMAYLHLIDNLTGNDVDLLQTPSYTFTARNDDYASRFKLVFSAQQGGSATGNNFAFISNGNLMILGIEGKATLQMIDVTGHILSTETFNGNYNKAVNVKAGVYMLRLIQSKNVRTQKIIIK